MNICRYDTFEDTAEIDKMVLKLQSESYSHMRLVDAWDIQSHAEAMKSTKIMAGKVAANL